MPYTWITAIDGALHAADGDALRHTKVTVVSHTFVLGNLMYHNGTIWALAAKTTKRSTAVIVRVVADDFYLIHERKRLNIPAHGWVVGSDRYLGAGGVSQASKPTAGADIVRQLVYEVQDTDWVVFEPSVWKIL